MLENQAISLPGEVLSNQAIFDILHKGLAGQLSNQKILALIPDHTRSLPLPFLFRALVEILQDTKKLDFMVALGTHPALTNEAMHKLVGITSEERDSNLFKNVGLVNHTWDVSTALTSLGSLEQEQIRQIAGARWHPSLPDRVEVRLNKAALEYDYILILGPTFPHEVAGFSGGAKYIFPGISGPEMINATHWLGALSGVAGTIGVKDTPVRAMIHAAAAKLPTPITLIALVVEGDGIGGIFIGDHVSAWGIAAHLSAQRHIRWCEKPFQRVLSVAPPMYDELWTAAKAMYKLEPAVAPGGEVIIYAPHLETISHVHGKYIYETGYHILDYFLADWERFRNIPLGVLAHSTHVRGSGHMDGEVERPNVRVSLASRIPPEDCSRLNLGYVAPESINIQDWQNRENEGILYVPKAGEILYKLKSQRE